MKKTYFFSILLIASFSISFLPAKITACNQDLVSICTDSDWDDCETCLKSEWNSWVHEQWPTWKCAKRLYRNSTCNYKEKCASHCAKNKKNLFTECELSDTCTDEMLLNPDLLVPFMELYHYFTDDEEICKYEKKCYQYGFCPSTKCLTEEDLINHTLPPEELAKLFDLIKEADTKERL